LNSKSHGYDSDEDDWDDTVSVASSSASTLVDFERSNHGLTMVAALSMGTVVAWKMTGLCFFMKIWLS
jgi:hypothetical protein